MSKHRAASDSKSSLTFFQVALARTRWAISDWLVLRGLKKPKGRRVLAIEAPRPRETSEEPERVTDISVGVEKKIPGVISGNKVEQFIGRTAPSPALMTVEIRRRLVETGALNPQRIRASNCS